MKGKAYGEKDRPGGGGTMALGLSEFAVSGPKWQKICFLPAVAAPNTVDDRRPQRCPKVLETGGHELDASSLLELGVGVSSHTTSLLLSRGGAEGRWSLAALKTQNVLEPAETHNLPKQLEPVTKRRSPAVIGGNRRT